MFCENIRMNVSVYLEIQKIINLFLLPQNKYAIPSPFYFNKKKAKAILLGCDQSNFS